MYALNSDRHVIFEVFITGINRLADGHHYIPAVVTVLFDGFVVVAEYENGHDKPYTNTEYFFGPEADVIAQIALYLLRNRDEIVDVTGVCGLEFSRAAFSESQPRLPMQVPDSLKGA